MGAFQNYSSGAVSLMALTLEEGAWKRLRDGDINYRFHR